MHLAVRFVGSGYWSGSLRGLPSEGKCFKSIIPELSKSVHEKIGRPEKRLRSISHCEDFGADTRELLRSANAWETGLSGPTGTG